MKTIYKFREIAIAIIVTVLITYVFIKRANVEVLFNLRKLSGDIVTVNENINTVNNNTLTIATNVDSINTKQDYNIQKGFEISDSLQTTIQLLKKTNNMLIQHGEMLKLLNRKQNIIMDSIKKIR